MKTHLITLELLKEIGIPGRYHNRDIRAYTGRPEALTSVNKYIANFGSKALPNGIGLILEGMTHSDKTLLVCHLLKNLAIKGYTCRYFTADQLADIEIGKKVPAAFRSSFIEPTMVAIDNTENFTSTFGPQVLMKVLRARIDSGLPFIIATRLQSQEWNASLGDGISQLFEHYAVRVLCFANQQSITEERRKLKQAVGI